MILISGEINSILCIDDSGFMQLSLLDFWMTNLFGRFKMSRDAFTSICSYLNWCGVYHNGIRLHCWQGARSEGLTYSRWHSHQPVSKWEGQEYVHTGKGKADKKYHTKSTLQSHSKLFSPPVSVLVKGSVVVAKRWPNASSWRVCWPGLLTV